MIGKIYVGLLVESIVSVSLIDDEKRGFRVERGYVDQIFTLKQISEKS